MRLEILCPLIVLCLAACTSDAGPAVPLRADPTDHADLIQGTFTDGPSVTRECLRCHPDAAKEVMATPHWTWLGEEVPVEGRPEPMRIGKRNLLNNFCIGVQSNWPRCTSCHAGYGWKDGSFDFTKEENVDCLVCHDGTGSYRKSPTGAGLPDEKVDLLAVARGVGPPTRKNCGFCHFSGGGGDAVKHGDLDGTMFFPADKIDVHMGRHDIRCVDCHRTERHAIAGRSMAVSIDDTRRILCTDCHPAEPHRQDRLNTHAITVACQSCHIPRMAIGVATKMSWDWSEAGQEIEVDDPRLYDKKKGRFTFAQDVPPEYYWYNGRSRRYVPGDRIDPGKVVSINRPLGDARDPQAKIWPFKVHRGKQIYDRKHLHLLVPKTYGEGGYWTEFDWDKAARLGSEASGIPYSGEYGFVETRMSWPLSHMVQPKERALQCPDCHGEGGRPGRMDWEALGYPGDPALQGGR